MAQSNRKKNEPIAIVGMAFRFPGDVGNETEFWDALKTGKDLIQEIPSSRWATRELQHPNRKEPGRSITFSAGILSRIEEFDAGFFNISPREAVWMDPQQRLLLELSWEAMENAGQVPSQIAGSNCGVFVGISGLDYGVKGIADLASITAHTMTGSTLSIAANRISYAFDLHGPSFSVDTACSSAMVALHQACESLQKGESPVALVGSANLLLHPYPFVGFTKASMISAQGRCRPFDASASGYVRSEGAAVLLLKPLSDAEKAGDPIHAVILASGVNADGGRKTGLTIPSGEAQEELMHSVLQQAGISPLQVDYIEAHGTGTPVGDPIEAGAIGEVYGKHRTSPLPIGSVKSNLGHLEAASGMAGLVKTILMLKHQSLPHSLHFNVPNPQIPFDDLNVRVVQKFTQLPFKKERVMGVNSFGFGGANAHVLLQGYDYSSQMPVKDNRYDAVPLFLSAKSSTALQVLAKQYAEVLPASPHSYYDIAYSAAFHREKLDYCLVVNATDRTSAAQSLAQFAQHNMAVGVVTEHCKDKKAGAPVFVYTGNGSQWLGMGQNLLKESPRFLAIMADLDKKMNRAAKFSILKELRSTPETSRLEDTEVAQPLLFAVQVAVTQLLQERGIKPQAVMGHSAGEIAAAWAAGALTLAQAITVICARSAAQAKTKGQGRMAAVGLSAERLDPMLREHGLATIEIAGTNSPSSITVSGSLQELETLGKSLKPSHIFFRLLDLDYAFHSRFMDPIEKEIVKNLASLKPKSTTLPFISTVTGEVIEGTKLTAKYWWDNIRKPVRFAEALRTLLKKDCRIFVEIGPHAILQRYMAECLEDAKVAGRVLPALLRQDDHHSRINEIALRLHLLADGQDLGCNFSHKGQFVTLPTYPWQRERHWLEPTEEGYNLLHRTRVHPLLGWRLKEHEAAWENTIDCTTYTYLADHKLAGAIVFPAAGYIEMALAAASEWYQYDSCEIEDMEIVSPIVFDGEHAHSLRLEIDTQDGSFRILSRLRLSTDDWNMHVQGRILGAPLSHEYSAAHEDSSDNIVMLPPNLHYQLTQAVGLNYGPHFQGFKRGLLKGQMLEGELLLPQAIEADSASYILHPVLLDSCFQSLVHFFRESIEAGQGIPLLPVKMGRMRHIHKTVATRFQLHVRHTGLRSVEADYVLFDKDDKLVAVLEECRFRRAHIQHVTSHEPAQWHTITKPVPHPQEHSALADLSNAALAKQLREAMKKSTSFAERRRYFLEGKPLSDALVIACIYEAFTQLHLEHYDWSLHAIKSPLHVSAEQRALFQWCVQRLQDTNLLHVDEQRWRLDEKNAPPSSQSIWQTLLAEFPQMLPELVFIGRMGQHLASLLHDGQHPFASSIEHSHLFASLWDNTWPHEGINQALIKVLGKCAQDIPTGCSLRVLEISSGSEELTRFLVSELPSEQLDYVVAVPDSEMLAHLEAEYQSHPNVTVASAKFVDFSLTAAKALPDKYDIIILHHWLHNASNPMAALASLRGKLAVGGKLVIAERYASYSSNFIFGSRPHWWREQSGQFSSSLLQPDAWSGLLKSLGLEDIESVIDPADSETHSGAYLLCATAAETLSNTQPAAAAADWLVICDPEGFSYKLAHLITAQLMAASQSVSVLELSIKTPEESQAAHALLEPHLQQQPQHVLYLSGLDRSASEGVQAPQTERCNVMLVISQLLGKQIKPARLWCVTSAAALTSSTDFYPHPDESMLWGMGRVIMNEYPALSCTLIDIPYTCEAPEIAPRLVRELLYPDGEHEILLAPESRLGLRMQRYHAPQSHTPMTRYKLDFQVAGQLRNLRWFASEERALAPDEIEIKTMATGLNFRDVMYAMGLLPDEAVENGFAGASLGLECAGIIVRVGNGVTQFRVGDAVMGFAPACFGSHVITRENAITRKPESWSFAQAATVPTVFFTVYYALKHLANVQPGERVLIHGAAGGVGIAAIQLARALGLEVFATAGSDEKRDFARLLGADHVFDSRKLSFADEIMERTKGEGVDVILNSLAGEAIRRNLRILKPFGRFLELGKRDFYENTSIGLRPFKDNISYFGIDADQLLLAKPTLAAELFREMMALFESGTLTPLPYRLFGAEHIGKAFRYMQQSWHIGKIVVDFSDANIMDVSQSPIGKLQLQENATYLVTGGLEGFGLESVRWLVAHGAKHIAIVSRRGLNTPNAHEVVAELLALGASVSIFAADVADFNRMKTVWGEIKTSMPPIRGILHAAMVLDDALLGNLTPERLEKVLRPKMMGAWNLHQLSLSHPLDYFILYSSITTYIGNPGQGNYVAANAYLEALAALRRKDGLPATCIGWGAIGDAGYLTRNTVVKDSLAARLGAKPLQAKQALQVLENFLQKNISSVAVADLEWSALAKLLPGASEMRFSLLRSASMEGEGADNSGDIFALIAGKTTDEVKQLIQSMILAEAGKILSLSPERIDTSKSVQELGMDSLMTVELALALEQRFGVHMPAMAMSEGGRSIERISVMLVEKLTSSSDTSDKDALSNVVSMVGTQHVHAFSEEEIAQTVEDVRLQINSDQGGAA